MEEFLNNCGLSGAIDTFRDENIKIDHVCDLSTDEIKELLPRIGDRVTFRKAIERKRDEEDHTRHESKKRENESLTQHESNRNYVTTENNIEKPPEGPQKTGMIIEVLKMDEAVKADLIAKARKVVAPYLFEKNRRDGSGWEMLDYELGKLNCPLCSVQFIPQWRKNSYFDWIVENYKRHLENKHAAVKFLEYQDDSNCVKSITQMANEQEQGNAVLTNTSPTKEVNILESANNNTTGLKPPQTVSSVTPMNKVVLEPENKELESQISTTGQPIETIDVESSNKLMSETEEKTQKRTTINQSESENVLDEKECVNEIVNLVRKSTKESRVLATEHANAATIDSSNEVILPVKECEFPKRSSVNPAESSNLLNLTLDKESYNEISDTPTSSQSNEMSAVAEQFVNLNTQERVDKTVIIKQKTNASCGDLLDHKCAMDANNDSNLLEKKTEDGTEIYLNRAESLNFFDTTFDTEVENEKYCENGTYKPSDSVTKQSIEQINDLTVNDDDLSKSKLTDSPTRTLNVTSTMECDNEKNTQSNVPHKSNNFFEHSVVSQSHLNERELVDCNEKSISGLTNESELLDDGKMKSDIDYNKDYVLRGQEDDISIPSTSKKGGTSFDMEYGIDVSSFGKLEKTEDPHGEAKFVGTKNIASTPPCTESSNKSTELNLEQSLNKVVSADSKAVASKKNSRATSKRHRELHKVNPDSTEPVSKKQYSKRKEGKDKLERQKSTPVKRKTREVLHKETTVAVARRESSRKRKIKGVDTLEVSTAQTSKRSQSTSKKTRSQHLY